MVQILLGVGKNECSDFAGNIPTSKASSRFFKDAHIKNCFKRGVKFVSRLVCTLAEKSHLRFVNRIDDFLNKSLSKMPSWLKCYNYNIYIIF